MATQPYDEVGAMGGLFAPAFIRGDPVSEAAVARWLAAHPQKGPPRYTPPSPIEAKRDAIAQALIGGSGSIGDQLPASNGVGGPGGTGFTGLGQDPDNPTDTTSPPTVSFAPPDTNKGTPPGDPENPDNANQPPGDPNAKDNVENANQPAAPPAVAQPGIDQVTVGIDNGNLSFAPPGVPGSVAPGVPGGLSVPGPAPAPPGPPAQAAVPNNPNMTQAEFDAAVAQAKADALIGDPTSPEGPVGPTPGYAIAPPTPAPAPEAPEADNLGKGINEALASLSQYGNLDNVPGVMMSLAPLGLNVTVPSIAVNQVNPTPPNQTLEEALQSLSPLGPLGEKGVTYGKSSPNPMMAITPLSLMNLFADPFADPDTQMSPDDAAAQQAAQEAAQMATFGDPTGITADTTVAVSPDDAAAQQAAQEAAQMATFGDPTGVTADTTVSVSPDDGTTDDGGAAAAAAAAQAAADAEGMGQAGVGGDNY